MARKAGVPKPGAKPRRPAKNSIVPKGRPKSPPVMIANKSTLKLIHFCGSIRMTQREAAMRLGVAIETFEKFMMIPEVRAAWEKGEGHSFVSLRSAQFKLARSNATMAIHMGKVYLGQKEEVHVSGHVTLENLVLESIKISEGGKEDENEPKTD